MLFDDDRWRAVAQYRAGDYAGAANGFGSFDDPESSYNLGNALARSGATEEAIPLAWLPNQIDATRRLPRCWVMMKSAP